MTEPRPGFWSRLPLPVVAVVVIVVAIAVGVPIGLASGSEGGSEAIPLPSSTTSDPAPTDPTDPTSPSEEPSEEPSDEPSDEPPGLSAAQAELWHGLEMGGVDRQSCSGYPDGEQLDGVVASLECEVEDPAITQPIVYHQFTGPAAVGAYLALRGSEIDRTGRCDDGDEAAGDWSVNGGPDVGSYVCVDNVKNGTTYFKIAFSYDQDSTAAVVQCESAADVGAWWSEHAAGQFYGVGNR